MNKKIKIKIKIADIFSFINAFLGFFAIITIFRIGNFYLVSFLLFLAVIIDFIDGKIARKFKHANEFGKNIDSLADIVSFGVAPAILLQQFLSGYAVFVPFLLIIGGIYRLARFNISKEKYFIGLPITFNGFIIPLFYVLGILNGNISILLSIVLFILMISKLKIKKIL
ncbi:MAG: CDP-diacylglycerol--serine O-phosphatidyltransferase [Candidatus Aenigmatarchaeota archaeon]